jgi:hypothetical protein
MCICMWLCVYVCECVCMYVCTVYIYIYIYIYSHTYKNHHINTYIHTYSAFVGISELVSSLRHAGPDRAENLVRRLGDTCLDAAHCTQLVQVCMWLCVPPIHTYTHTHANLVRRLGDMCLDAAHCTQLVQVCTWLCFLTCVRECVCVFVCSCMYDTSLNAANCTYIHTYIGHCSGWRHRATYHIDERGRNTCLNAPHYAYIHTYIHNNAQAGGIGPLITLMKEGTIRAREYACGLLGKITQSDAELKKALNAMGVCRTVT